MNSRLVTSIVGFGLMLSVIYLDDHLTVQSAGGAGIIICLVLLILGVLLQVWAWGLSLGKQASCWERLVTLSGAIVCVIYLGSCAGFWTYHVF